MNNDLRRSSRHAARPFCWALLLCSALLLLSFGCKPGGSEPSGNPIVVLVTVDGLLAEELSAFGGELETPTLESWVAEGRVWRDVWTTSPMTRPAVATYLTGLAPDRHGVRGDASETLGDEIPTLAELLAAAGYRTAAFPDSSFLGRASGLLRGFDVVDDPPLTPISLGRFIPKTRAAAELTSHFTSWLEGVGPDERYFAWMHFSQPLLEQLEEVSRPGLSQRKLRGPVHKKTAEGEAEEIRSANLRLATGRGGSTAIDAALTTVLERLEARGESERALILVVGTQADIRGGETDLIGPGYSLDERAIRVPLFVRFPSGAGTPRGTENPVWAPDVAATIADMSGIELSAEAEGISLLEETDPARPLFSWGWAPLDQMGWRAQRAARAGMLKTISGLEARTIRLDDPSITPDPDELSALDEALKERERSEPAAPEVDFESVREILARAGAEFRPADRAGRDFGPQERRRALLQELWIARARMNQRAPRRAAKFYRIARDVDPDNKAVLLELGRFHALSGEPEESKKVLAGALSLYPGDVDLLHWLAHALWGEAVEDGETLLRAVLPYRESDGDVLYDLACARSIAGDLAASEEFLGSALAAGYANWAAIEVDPDLRNLRESDRYAEILREHGR